MYSVLKAEGLDWRAALAAAHLNETSVERVGGTVTGSNELAFQEEFVKQTGDRVELWLEVYDSYTIASFGIRGLALLTAPTISAYIEVSDGSTEIGPGLLEAEALRNEDDDVIGIQFVYPGVPKELFKFSVYRELSHLPRMLPWMSGGEFVFSRIEVPLNDVAPPLRARLNCPVETGSDALRLWWDAETAKRPLPFSNAFQYETFMSMDSRIIESLRSTGDWVFTIRQAIQRSPALNRKLENAALTLGVSSRTLQRRLAEVGEEFGDVRDSALNDAAQRFLSSSNYSVARVSRMLGYADSTSFSTAFKRWNGMSPTAFRKASAAPLHP